MEQCAKVQCPRLDDRKKRLQTLDWVRTRRWPKELKLPDFDDRLDPAKKWRPFAKRRPGARYDIHAIVTRDVVSMLAGDGRFPVIAFEDDAATDAFAETVRTVNLAAILNQAATLASIGSVVIVPEVIIPIDGDGNPWLSWTFWRAFEVDPVFRRDRPDVLESVTRTWNVSRAQLSADGFDLDALDAKAAAMIKDQIAKPKRATSAVTKYTSWYRRTTLDANRTINYEPVPKEVYHQNDWNNWAEDPQRSAVHDLNFCPAWFYTTFDDQDAKPDGACIFEAAIDNAILIDRVLSVAAHAVVAAGTPQLAVVKKNNGPGLDQLSGDLNPEGREIDPDSILEVDEKGGAWLVQLEGGLTPLDVVLSRLRMITLENVGGSRMSEETATGAKSGYAMELLNQALTYVAGLMRPGYERAVIGLVRMLARMVDVFGDIDCDGGTLKKSTVVILIDALVKAISYGPNYELNGQDKMFEVKAVVSAIAAGLLSEETGIAQIAQLFDVTDIENERKRVAGDTAKKQQTEDAAADVAHKRALELKAVDATPKGAAA